MDTTRLSDVVIGFHIQTSIIWYYILTNQRPSIILANQRPSILDRALASWGTINMILTVSVVGSRIRNRTENTFCWILSVPLLLSLSPDLPNTTTTTSCTVVVHMSPAVLLLHTAVLSPHQSFENVCARQYQSKTVRHFMNGGHITAPPTSLFLLDHREWFVS